MNTEAKELITLFNLLTHIMDYCAADADAVVNWRERRIEVTIDQGGKTIYAATLEMDSPALEAKARLIRHELERMIEECELPILFKGVA